jgi:hypothetical protein
MVAAKDTTYASHLPDKKTASPLTKPGAPRFFKPETMA